MPYHQLIAGLDENHEQIEWKDHFVWRNGVKIEPQAVIDDELFNYLSDTFAWVRAQYPNGKWGDGFDPYAYSIVRDRRDLERLREIASAWRNLFELGPEQIVLTGNYGWVEGEAPQKGTYDRLRFEKAELTESMTRLIEVVDTALKNGQYVIHFGI